MLEADDSTHSTLIVEILENKHLQIISHSFDYPIDHQHVANPLEVVTALPFFKDISKL